MDVILLTKVANLGNIGDRVKVKSGYGRNFLLPKGKATLATPDNVKKFEARRAELEKVAREQFADAESRAAAFKDFKLAITAKAGTEGKPDQHGSLQSKSPRKTYRIVLATLCFRVRRRKRCRSPAAARIAGRD